jgi:serine/threonine-protein kinase
MGEVWSATDEPTGAAVAVKTLRSSALSNPDLVARFEREMEAMDRLSKLPSTHLVKLLAAATTPQPYMVLERIIGQSLEERLYEVQVIEPDELRPIIREVLETLGVLHDAGIIHRDLKPSNILLTQEGVKLIDFGVAKLVGEDVFTTDGATVGSIAYAAPEQIVDASKVDARADLYAVGTILYRAVTGRMPFADKNLPGLLALKRDFEAPALELTPSRYPEPLTRFVASLLARDPSRRPPSAADALAIWRTIGSWKPGAAEPPPEHTDTMTFSRDRKR